jgi:hypothetical protein
VTCSDLSTLVWLTSCRSAASGESMLPAPRPGRRSSAAMKWTPPAARHHCANGVGLSEGQGKEESTWSIRPSPSISQSRCFKLRSRIAQDASIRVDYTRWGPRMSSLLSPRAANHDRAAGWPTSLPAVTLRLHPAGLQRGWHGDADGCELLQLTAGKASISRLPRPVHGGWLQARRSQPRLPPQGEARLAIRNGQGHRANARRGDTGFTQ